MQKILLVVFGNLTVVSIGKLVANLTKLHATAVLETAGHEQRMQILDFKDTLV